MEGPTVSNTAEHSSTHAAFIHSKLDEYGLTPVQFRIFCHIERRGECFSTAAVIAQCCRVHRNTVWPALKFLKNRKMIEATHRTGLTTIFKAAPFTAWLPLDNPPQSNSRVGRPQVIAIPHPKASATHPPQSNSHKVYPSEGSPIKGEAPPYIENENREYRSLKNWQLRKDIKYQEKRIQMERDSQTPDWELVRAMKTELGMLHDEQKRRNRPPTTAQTPLQTTTAAGPFADLRRKPERQQRQKAGATENHPAVGIKIPHEEFMQGCQSILAAINGQTDPEVQ